MTFSYLIRLANYSDGILYILAALLLLALGVMIDRFWSLRLTLASGESVIQETAAHTHLGRAQLEALLDRAGALPEAALLHTAIRYLDNASAETMANRLDEAIMLMAPKLDRRLWILDTAVTLAPLLGLFGTIIGMFHAFSVLARPGHAPADVTAGVADALVATAFGILIAMIGLAAFNALSNQVRLVLHQLDSLKVMVCNRIDGAEARPPGSANRTAVNELARA